MTSTEQVAQQQAALALLASLVIDDDGTRWGEVADDVQWSDATAILLPGSDQPFNYLTRARGRSKTTDLGGILAAAMLTQLGPGSRCYAAASDSGQASLLLDAFRDLTGRTPELADAFTCSATRAVCNRSGAVLDVLAADAAGAWGLRPDFMIVDELAGWAETRQPRRLYEALRSAMGKVAGSRMVVLTSAGAPSHWAMRELEHAQRSALWRVNEAVGPPGWMSPERLAEQKSALPESVYLRLFENRWTDAENVLVSRDAVLACRRAEGALDPVRGASYVHGVDLSVVSDYTVVTTAHVRADGDRRIVVLDRLACWKPTRKSPVPMDEVESYIVAVAKRFPGKVFLDPFQAAGLSQSLRRQGLAATDAKMTQAGNSNRAMILHRLLRDRLLEIPGDDAELVDELASLAFTESSPGLYKLASTGSGGGHHDRATALSICAEALLQRTAWSGDSWIFDSSPGVALDGTALLHQVGEFAYNRADLSVGGIVSVSPAGNDLWSQP